ncbi:MAG: hypothetical protein AAGF83_28010 [Cyanobacteria bacterium P01_G01_bin.67]
MDCHKPVFSTSDSSINSTARELHAYFRNLQAYYKVLKGQVISELEYHERPETVEELKIKLQEIERKLRYIHILNNSASTIDEVVHLAEIREEFCLKKETVRA